MSEESTVTTEEVVETTETTTEATTEKAFVDSMLESMTDEEVKGHKMWDNLKGKSADELGKYVRELKSFTGKKGDIPKPLDEGGTEEEWNAFHSKLGRPDSIDGYDWNLGADFRELVGDQSAFYEQATDWFKDAAFKAGISNSKAEELFNGYLEMTADQFKSVGEIRETRESEAAVSLKNEWGDSREGIELGIKAMLKEKGGLDAEAVDSLIDAGLFKEPKLAIALGKISSKFADDHEIGHLHTGTKAGLQDQKMAITTQMMKETAEFGEPRPETSRKWKEIIRKLGDDL